MMNLFNLRPKSHWHVLLTALLSITVLVGCNDDSNGNGSGDGNGSASNGGDSGNGDGDGDGNGGGSDGAISLEFEVPPDAKLAADLTYSSGYSSDTSLATVNSRSEAQLATDAFFLGSFTRVLLRDIYEEFRDESDQNIANNCGGNLDVNSDGATGYELLFDNFCISYPKEAGDQGELTLNGQLDLDSGAPGNVFLDRYEADSLQVDFWGESFNATGVKLDVVDNTGDFASHRSMNLDIEVNGAVYKFTSDRGSVLEEELDERIVMQAFVPGQGKVIATIRPEFPRDSEANPFQYPSSSFCPDGQDPFPKGPGIDMQSEDNLDLSVNPDTPDECGRATLSGTYSNAADQQAVDFSLTESIFN